MRRLRQSSRVWIIAFTLGACQASVPGAQAPAYTWRLPPNQPTPRVPSDNPMSDVKVALGRRLFYDRRLSANLTQSCADCHLQALAFTDGKPHGVGSTGEQHPRSSMSLANVGYATTLTWANPLMTSLEQQALLPLFGEVPVELGNAGAEDALLVRLGEEPLYRDAFSEVFGGEVSVDGIAKALAAFQRTLVSANSPYDRFNRGEDPNALGPAARRGMELFFSERLECFHCHGGFSFADAVAHDGTQIIEAPFHNNGLYNVGDLGRYPEENPGLEEITGRAEDNGKMKAPTLRNIAVTAPYMHDGSIATLSLVIDHYARGGRRISDGPLSGDGARHPQKSGFVRGFLISDDEKADLLAFLNALTDDTFLTDPALSNPWETP